jgi:hypothetical protein
MPYVKEQFNFQNQNGYVLSLALSLILLTSIASASAIHTASTQIISLGSEKQYLQAFQATEVQLVSIEKLLQAGVDPSSIFTTMSHIEIEPFEPKYFRSKSGTLSQHYKIKAFSPAGNWKSFQIQTTIRIDEITQSIKNKPAKKVRVLQRLSWEMPS